jgi:hypothetical protein
LAAFVLVALAQLWLVSVAGTDIPFQDQWDVEGGMLYPALQAGTFHPAVLLQPHNEHHIFWTKLLDVLLFRANGQWDPLVQLAVGAALHAAVAAALTAGLVRGLNRGAGWLMVVAVVLGSLPVAAWHNALWGFQSQVYFVVLFTALAFARLADGEGSPGRQVAGWLVGVAALLAMGPGLLVPVVMVVWLIARAIERRIFSLPSWSQVIPASALLVTAWGLHQSVPEHEAFAAGSMSRFLFVLGEVLAWPCVDQPAAALVLNLPLVLLVVGRLTGRRRAARGEDFVVLLGLWAVGVAVATAWVRGGGDELATGVPSRYVDMIVLLPLANLWCLVRLVGEAGARWCTSSRQVATAWGVLLFAGWLGLSAQAMRGIVLPRLRDREAPVRLMREFQRSGDAAVFAGRPRLLVPHPNPESVRRVLQDTLMHGAMPPSLQPGRPQGPLSRWVRGMLWR